MLFVQNLLQEPSLVVFEFFEIILESCLFNLLDTINQDNVVELIHEILVAVSHSVALAHQFTNLVLDLLGLF